MTERLGDGAGQDGGVEHSASDTKRCELCRENVESYTLTSDSHPEGPNHVVGQCCVYTDSEHGGDAVDE